MKKMRKLVTLLLCTIMIVNCVFAINTMNVQAETPMGKFSMTFVGDNWNHAVVKYTTDGFPDFETGKGWNDLTWHVYTGGVVEATRVLIVPEEGFVFGGENAAVSAMAGENAEQPTNEEDRPTNDIADYHLCGTIDSWDGLFLLRGWSYTFTNLELVESHEEPAKLTVGAYNNEHGTIEYLDIAGNWQTVPPTGTGEAVSALEVRANCEESYALKKDGREDSDGWKVNITGPDGMSVEDIAEEKQRFINDFYDYNQAGLGPDLSYTLSDIEFLVGYGTFRWSYEIIPGHEDEYVGHGKIKIKKATFNNQELDNSNNEHWKNDSEFTEPINGEQKTWTGGEGAFTAGTVVTIELVPERGYQLTKFTINEQPNSTTAQGEISTFTFKVPPKNFHLGAEFTEMRDEVDSSVSGIGGGTLNIADSEFSNGTAALTVSNTSVSASEESSFVSNAQQNGFEVAKYVDLKLENRFYKGNTTDYWTTNEQKTTLVSPATISLNLTDITADDFEIIHQKHDGTYEVIPATYSGGTVQFQTDSFSKFAIVAKGLNKIEEPESSNDAPESVLEMTSVELEAREIYEESLPIILVEKEMVYGKTANEVVMPVNTYDLSGYLTTKGFVSALNKVISANNKSSSISIYTDKPFCFSAMLLKAICDGKKDVVYYFMYKGHLYSVTIPTNVSIEKVLEKNGFAGPLYVGKQLGTTRLIW